MSPSGWALTDFRMGIFKSSLVMTRNHDSVAGVWVHGDDLSRCTKDGFLSLSKELSALKRASFLVIGWVIILCLRVA